MSLQFFLNWIKCVSRVSQNQVCKNAYECLKNCVIWVPCKPVCRNNFFHWNFSKINQFSNQLWNQLWREINNNWKMCFMQGFMCFTHQCLWNSIWIIELWQFKMHFRAVSCSSSVSCSKSDKMHYYQYHWKTCILGIYNIKLNWLTRLIFN